METALFLLIFICVDPAMLIAGVVLTVSKTQGGDPRIKWIGILLTLPFTLGAVIMFAAIFSSVVLGPSLTILLVGFSSPALTLIVVVLIAIILLIPIGSKHKAKVGISLPDILTIDEAAGYLHVSPDAVQQLIQNGQLFATKEQNSYRISRDDLMRFLQ